MKMPSSRMLRRVALEVFTAVTMKNAVFWDVTPCGSCKNPVDEVPVPAGQCTSQEQV
jgi:hypothetical protein